MVSFAGYDMPIHYKSIIQEHQVVRNDVGMFDVSHMGQIGVSGEQAAQVLDYLSTNKIAAKANNTATYTVWCHSHGGSVDDLMIYKRTPDSFFLIVNASNREKDLAHLLEHVKGFKVTVEPRFDQDGILAVQGPKAVDVVAKIFPESKALAPMRFFETTYDQTRICIAATGYTGAGGIEIIAPNAVIVALWDRLLQEGVEPIGLGARDTLRLEMGYALYGNELDDQISALESVSAWTVKLDKSDFLGKVAMQTLLSGQNRRFAYGIVLKDKAIVRHGNEVYREGKKIGLVTSGSFSPSLQASIALILVNETLNDGDHVTIQIRQQQAEAIVTKLPFWQANHTS